MYWNDLYVTLTCMYTECKSSGIIFAMCSSYIPENRTVFFTVSYTHISLKTSQADLRKPPRNRLKQSVLTVTAAKQNRLHPVLCSELWFNIIQWAHIHINSNSDVSSKDVMFILPVLYLLLKKERKIIWLVKLLLVSHRILNCFKNCKCVKKVIEKGLTLP